MANERLGVSLGIPEDLINKACVQAFQPHHGQPFLVHSDTSSEFFIISFAPSWSLSDWFSDKTFGEIQIDPSLFPSLKSIGNDVPAQVHNAFLSRFLSLLSNQSFVTVVEKARSDGKRIVFTGHSSGGPMAILATLWILEKVREQTNSIPSHPVCLTFGSPLVGNHIFSHATNRENWSRLFIHFVLRYDVVPRISLAPFSSVERTIDPILQVLSQENGSSSSEPIRYLEFYNSVMKNTSTAASHGASSLMGAPDSLLETVKNLVVLSPYRPFGTFVVCTGNGRLVVMKNSEAVLQVLFHSAVLSEEGVGDELAKEKVLQHLGYGNELEGSLEMQNVVYLYKLDEVPLSKDNCSDDDASDVDGALNDLGLGKRARLCLRAAGKLEKQKYMNEARMEKEAEVKMKELEDYKERCRDRKVGYYDAFKVQNDIDDDFKANVNRMEIATAWDEIIDMLKRYELPDEFEGKTEWVEMGTKYRRLVEPLDIANYYRHSKDEDTGPYMDRGRPKRYRYTQRWLEHKKRLKAGDCSESCFWAETEELVSKTNKGKFDEEFNKRVDKLKQDLDRWGVKDEILKDVLLEGTTFIKWWKGKLPQRYKSGRFTFQAV